MEIKITYFNSTIIKMTIQEVITGFKIELINGVQLTKRKGILTSTWVLYYLNGHFFYFDISEPFTFDDNHKYSNEEIIKELTSDYFEIDTDVS